MQETGPHNTPPPPALEAEKLAEALRGSLKEESSFWAQVHEMGPKLRMLALAIFALVILFAVGLWLLQTTVEGQKAVLESAPPAQNSNSSTTGQ